MSKSLKKRLEEEGRWEQVENNNKINLKTPNISNTSAQTFTNQNKLNNTWNNIINRANNILVETTNNNMDIIKNFSQTKKEEKKKIQNNILPVTNNVKKEIAESKYDKNKEEKEKRQQEKVNSASSLPEKVFASASNTVENILQKPKQFYDGYQVGDVTKAALSTAVNTGVHIIGGVEQTANFIPQTFGYGMAEINFALGNDETAKRWIKATQDEQSQREELRNKIFNITGGKSSIVGDTTNQVTEGIGQSTTFGVIGGANKIAGGLMTAGQGFGEGLQETYSEEDVKGWQALLKSTGSGLVSYVSENMFENMGFGGSGIDDAIKKRVTRGLEKGFSKALARTGISATGEGIEEIVEYLGNKGLNWTINQITNALGEGAKFDTETDIAELTESFLVGALSGGFSEGASTFGGNVLNANTKINQIEQETGKKLTNKQKSQIREQTLLKSEIQRENEIIIEKSKLTKEQKEIAQKIIEKYDLSNTDVKNLIDNTLNGKYNETIKKQNTIIENKPLLPEKQQTILPEAKTNQNETSQEIQDVAKNTQVETQKQANLLQDSTINKENVNKTINDLKEYTKISDKEKSDINDLTKLNMNERKDAQKINFINTKDVVNNIMELGKRDKDTFRALIEDVKESGIISPIYISEETGKIVDGGHRALVAQALGIDSVPVKYIKSSNDIALEGNDWYNNLQERKQVYEQERRANAINEGNGYERINNNRSDATSDGEYNRQNNRLYKETQKISDRPSTETIYGGNTALGERVDNETEISQRKIVDEVYREDINEGKTRKHYQSVFESEQVGKVGKEVAKELYKTDTYTPVANVQTMSEVNDNIQRNGIDRTYEAFMYKIGTNERITLQDIATGERLIQIYSQNGDIAKVNQLIQNVAILGTELGQQVQALSLIKKASPEGQLQYLTKLLDRTNLKENTNIKITDEMAQKILKSQNEKELQNNMSEVAEELANKLPLKTSDKIRSWRYLSMLGNPRTHIRNLVANVAMNLTQNAKNVVAGGMEDVASIFNKELERTKTLKRSNKDQITFASQDAEIMKDLIDSGGKYDIKNIIQNSKRSFDNNALNSIAEFNSDLLDTEDKIFLKIAYKQALQNYMTANNLNSNQMTGKILEKARQYASVQAQEATFHQFSVLAQLINQSESKGGIVGYAVGAILPFKKTPINIAKAGIQYSPIGIANSITQTIIDITKTTNDLKTKLKNGKITDAEYKTATSKIVTDRIDQMSKGLTGTTIALIGYALAKSGLLKSGNDDDKDKFKDELGNQEYAIKIGNNTYSLDWIAPSAIPLFVGASIYDLVTGNMKDSGVNAVMTSLSKSVEPMTEMSMLQGLTSAISSYEQGSSNMLFDLGASVTSSYAGQFLPTAIGQLAKTIDPYVRDTTSTKQGLAKKIDQFKRQTMSKIPGISQKLPVKQDIWGEDTKKADNVIQRFLETSILPYNREKIQEDMTSAELETVFDGTGEKGVLPSRPEKDFIINKEKYRVTSEEYADMKKDFGQTSKQILNKLIKGNEYKKLTEDGKAKAIEDVYKYAKEKLKKDYADKQGQELKTSKMYNAVTELLKENGNIEKYFEYQGLINDLDRQNGDDNLKTKEKIEYLKRLKTDNKTKKIIYQDTFGEKDNDYKYLSKLENIDINAYLDYKTQDIKGTDDPNSLIKGRTIKGSKEENLLEYLNNSNLSDLDKIYIYGKSYKLNNSEMQVLLNAVENARFTQNEKYEFLKGLSSSNVQEYKDGTIRLKK